VSPRTLSEQILKDTVKEEAPVILRRWNPAISDESDLRTRIETEYLHICISYSLTYVNTEIQSPANQIGRSPIPLMYVLEAIAPQLPDSVSFPRYLHIFTGKGAVSGEAIRFLRLVSEYCYPLLDGDKDAWSVLEKWSVDWGGRVQRRGEKNADFLKNLKHRAQYAWARGNERFAYEFYSMYQMRGGHMTFQDRWCLMRSSMHEFPMP